MSSSASPFLLVGGIPLTIAGETWKERRIHIGDIRDKSLAGRPAVSRSGTIREWTFTAPRSFAATVAERMAWVDWIEGRGQKWSFDSTTSSYSAAGVTNSALGSFTRNAGGARTGLGGHIEVAAGSRFGVNMADKLGRRRGWTPASGYSMLFDREFVAGDDDVAAGWHFVSLTGAVDFARGSADNPVGVTQYLDGAALNVKADNFASVSASSPYCGVHGYENNGAVAAVIGYDELLFVPFEMSATWISSLYSQMIAQGRPLPNLPRQRIFGEWFTGDDADGVEVVGYVQSLEQRVGALRGSGWASNLMDMQVVFEEW